MKASSQTLKDLLADFLNRGEMAVVNRSEMAIVGLDEDSVRVTDDNVYYFEIRGGRIDLKD